MYSFFIGVFNIHRRRATITNQCSMAKQPNFSHRVWPMEKTLTRSNTHTSVPECARSLACGLVICACLSPVGLMAQTGDFCITDMFLAEDTVVVEWESTNTSVYTVQWCSNLMTEVSWSNLSDHVDMEGSVGFLSATDTVDTVRTRFYRVTRRPPPPYAHTITVDGVNDFTTNETFQTSTPGFTGFISWDADYIYFGMDGVDVSINDGTRLVLAYIGGSLGTTTGVMHNTQQPVLPFPARYHLEWTGDGTQDGLTKLYEFNGTNWELGVSGNLLPARSGNFVELRIPRADVGDPASVRMHLNMVNETFGSEWTWAAVPSVSFLDGYDPDFTRYFEFDFDSTAVPNGYSPLP